MSPRRTERLAGALFLLTHVTSVGAVLLYGPGGVDPTRPLAGRTAVLTGALLEVVLAVAVVGTSVALYPLVRSRAAGLAPAYVATRTLEAAVILTGVVALLPVVAVPGSADPAALDPGTAGALVGLHAWTFLVGPGLVCPVNTVVLAWLLHRDRMVPRVVTLLGLVGGPLIGLANLAVMSGLTGTLAVAAVPIFAWEVSLAVVLLVRGLRVPEVAVASLPRGLVAAAP
ncbi:DUF4386 domain-containing protein [Phycicoccus sonneratiae]|uniref:DUF4386 domain-containing protein n=1 Tax=Phycicoccus sonneratiae TaxID=2807628 RepID=A0ABS2CHD2_9MICO|nr:DUF4386 domain-containing protein [Phycicoccus sonneraticus]MBM6399289.1 DUF4386 domain-containing protein [Phycicoccus sonneraticus]